MRRAFCQAYRPQANGRADVCGRKISNSLQKLQMEGKVNWVEALPRALRIHYDMPNETGISPYQAVFERHRNLTEPLKTPISCQDAVNFCECIEDMERMLAKTLNEALRS